jgi:hypothetical protein
MTVTRPFPIKVIAVFIVTSFQVLDIGDRYGCRQVWAVDRQNPPAFGDSDWSAIQEAVRDNELELAEKRIVTYIRTHPDNLQAILLGARIARKLHKPNMGLAIVSKGLGRFPGDLQLRRLKAELLIERGDLVSSEGILESLERDPKETDAERLKVRQDRKALADQAFTVPPLTALDQNINFEESIPPPFLSPRKYLLENNSYHLHITDSDIAYAGGASIGVGIDTESPLIKNAFHFQAGGYQFLGLAEGKKAGIESFLYEGVNGMGPEGIQYVLDVGNIFSGSLMNLGLYGRIDVPVGPLKVEGQVWYQLPWSGYGQAIIQGALQSGGLVNATWNLTSELSVVAEYEYTYDSLQGTQIPFGTNHNTMLGFNWKFLDIPDFRFDAGYDTQTFTPSLLNPTSYVPILQSSGFGFAGFSSLNPIGRSVILKGEAGAIVGAFDTPEIQEGIQGDIGLSVQMTSRSEFYANVSYQSLAEGYIGSVASFMIGINFWF